MNPRGIEIWKWFARRRIARPSRPRLGRRGHLKMGPSGEALPGGVRERGEETGCGGEPPPEPEPEPELKEDEPVGWELDCSGVRVGPGWIMVPRLPTPTPNPRPWPRAPRRPGN